MKKDTGSAGVAREERLQIMLSPEELTVVDNFRFQHRMPSRAAAVRELFRLGLKSSEYGVLKAPKKRNKVQTAT
jgi:hypothetical protein